ncbi:baseplate J/gp47 family protein [Afifella aestuarii]|uniref:baseplate J/gp47 family protein n=1 Tax=Afifella aestuarii TaxID=1909496 RepID=UPI000FE43211|nr:baseplate J/gp47 family protein [Afifella aestuarii]
MATSTPSLNSLSQRIRGAFRQELPDTDATIWPNTLYVIGKVIAIALYEAHLRATWIYRQIFASTADGTHLDRHAYELGLTRKPATRAAGEIEITATPETIYPAGMRFLSGAQSYVATEAATASVAGALVVTVRAEQAGLAGNREADESVSLVDPALYSGVATTGSVGADGIGGGADRESDESLRARILDRKRRVPQGGAESDYEQFARAVPGVSKAWAQSFAGGPGTIGVWFLMEGRANGIPTASDVAAVQAALDERRMIRAAAIAAAPVMRPIDIDLTLVPDTEANRAAVEAQLAAMFAARARPGVAGDAFVMSVSWIAEAISIALGEDRHRLRAPLNDVVYLGGEMPVLGTIRYFS